MANRQTVIEITEREEGRATVGITATGPVNFELDYVAQRFPDPRVAELEAIVESQRAEIAKAQNEANWAKRALAEAKKLKKPARRR